MKLRGRCIHPGNVIGLALVSKSAISFFGGVDPDTGIVVEKRHELYGQSIAGKILAFPAGKGSTVGSYTLYRLKANALAPLAILNAECEPIIAIGCIISDIPCIDQIPIDQIKNGVSVKIYGKQARVEILE
jgi:predicted aconitase with swiveling domain